MDFLIDPLSTNTTNFKFWIDDFLISSVGTLQKDMMDVDKFLYRLNRLGLKINIPKSEFFINPIPAGGGGQFDPPCSFFYITQKVLV